MADFIDLREIESNALKGMIAKAIEIKNDRRGRPKCEPDADRPLAGRLAALLFEKPSTRTRISFDVGVRQLGGQTILLSGEEIHLGKRESIGDTARVLSRFVDLVMIRTFDEVQVRELAEHADVPVINGLTDQSHPCQIMADVMTFEEHLGPIEGKTVMWAGVGNNVCASFLHAAGQFGFDFTFTGPAGFDPNGEAVQFARSKGSRVAIERDPVKAVRGADLVVTDSWISMHDTPDTMNVMHNELRSYQINEDFMANAPSHALFMHCLPAHRGHEVTSEVMDGPNSVVFDESENRLHAQKAIMCWCLGFESCLTRNLKTLGG